MWKAWNGEAELELSLANREEGKGKTSARAPTFGAPEYSQLISVLDDHARYLNSLLFSLRHLKGSGHPYSTGPFIPGHGASLAYYEVVST